nr:hypothetical protein [Anaerobacillus sp. CMMVII]
MDAIVSELGKLRKK